MLPIRNNFKHEYTKRLKVKGQKKIYHAKEKKKKAGVTTLISDKVDFGERILLEIFILTKLSIHHEYII